MNLKLVIGVSLVVFAVSQVEGRCVGEKLKAFWERTKNVFKPKDQRVMYNETDPDCIKKAFKHLFRGKSMENAEGVDETFPKDATGDPLKDDVFASEALTATEEEEKTNLTDRFLFRLKCNDGFELIAGRCREIIKRDIPNPANLTNRFFIRTACQEGYAKVGDRCRPLAKRDVGSAGIDLRSRQRRSQRFQLGNRHIVEVSCLPGKRADSEGRCRDVY